MVCETGMLFGLSHGELFIVGYSLLTVVLAPYSGKAGEWLASLFASSSDS